MQTDKKQSKELVVERKNQVNQRGDVQTDSGNESFAGGDNNQNIDPTNYPDEVQITYETFACYPPYIHPEFYHNLEQFAYFGTPEDFLRPVAYQIYDSVFAPTYFAYPEFYYQNNNQVPYFYQENPYFVEQQIGLYPINQLEAENDTSGDFQDQRYPQQNYVVEEPDSDDNSNEGNKKEN